MKDGADPIPRAESGHGREDWTLGTRLSAAQHQDDALRRLVVGTLLARPFFDRVTLLCLRHAFFPASRLLAAAEEARGDAFRFWEAVPLPARRTPGRRLERLLARIERARATSRAVDAAWEEAFFGSGADEPARIALEAARIKARHDLNGMRWPLRVLTPTGVPAARLRIAPPAAVAGQPIELAPADALAAAAGPQVAVSRPLPTPAGVDYWLRFASPGAVVGDMVTARVHEPRGASNPPTIVFGHGVCVDFDHWLGLIDESASLVRQGFRVIRPEAPWHGRRTPPGTYAGERTIATFPEGIRDAMRAAVAEWAVLARWARAHSSGPLAFGGSSLGAMTAQLAAVAARPDALFLVTHTADMAAVVLDGALSDMWVEPREVAALGWTPELARALLAPLDAPETCPVPPDKVVSILGRRDTVLPYASGRQQLSRWGVPDANVFEWDRGHFTVPATLIRLREPLLRLVQVMR
ncbi:MAG: alpha/beta hydrolase family protein [Hyphomicrobiaceae bacterium]|nr:alpha/beta hydrolase family protein [Hyphomicrobiaceae bacterium]